MPELLTIKYAVKHGVAELFGKMEGIYEKLFPNNSTHENEALSHKPGLTYLLGIYANLSVILLPFRPKTAIFLYRKIRQ